MLRVPELVAGKEHGCSAAHEKQRKGIFDPPVSQSFDGRVICWALHSAVPAAVVAVAVAAALADALIDAGEAHGRHGIARPDRIIYADSGCPDRVRQRNPRGPA